MSHEPKKKPGDMAKARKRHLARQALSDKLKEISQSLEATPVAWHTIWDRAEQKSLRVKLTRFDLETYDVPTRVLVRLGNRLAIVHAPDKESGGGGGLYINDFWIVGHVPYKNVLAIVLESYERSPQFNPK